MLPSELILNEDGSIYHLHLLPEQVAETVIFVGDPERVPLVSQYFDRIELKVQKREFVTHTGFIGNKRVSVLSTGIGTDNIDIVMNELDTLFNIDLKTAQEKRHKTSLTIIRLGTSGSIQAHFPVDTVLLSEAAFGFDGLLHFYENNKSTKHPMLAALKQYAKGKWTFPAKPYFAAADPALFSIFSQYFKASGITATNSGFYAPQGRHLRAKPKHEDYVKFLADFNAHGRQITNLEMETAGIYGLGGLLGHRTLSVNALLANRAEGTFSGNPAKVVDSMIEITVRRILLELPL